MKRRTLAHPGDRISSRPYCRRGKGAGANGPTVEPAARDGLPLVLAVVFVPMMALVVFGLCVYAFLTHCLHGAIAGLKRLAETTACRGLHRLWIVTGGPAVIYACGSKVSATPFMQ